MSTQSLRGVGMCRLKRAYANAYATYAVCMGAYAWGIICLMEFPRYLIFCIQKKQDATQCQSIKILARLVPNVERCGAPIDIEKIFLFTNANHAREVIWGHTPIVKATARNDQNWLVVLTILKNISQWEGLSQILWKIKHVTNHQPEKH